MELGGPPRPKAKEGKGKGDHKGKGKGKGKGDGKGKSKSDGKGKASKGKGTETRKCFYCEKTGHLSAQCPKKAADKNRQLAAAPEAAQDDAATGSTHVRPAPTMGALVRPDSDDERDY
eukprot:1736595-Pyramimonas_sp.AAC.1